MNANLPTMASSTHSHTSYSTADIVGLGIGSGLTTGSEALQAIAANHPNHPGWNPPKGNPMSARRVVQVFIADTNENIPIDKCLLFKGEEKVTDATDQELFFELDIKTLLEKHNEMRMLVLDKKVKDRTEFLEPAKVRDLKMVVVTVANL
jgi:hypothetical protein